MFIQSQGNISLFFRAVKNASIAVYGNGVLYYQNRFEAGRVFKINLPFAASYQFTGDGWEFLKTTPIQKTVRNIVLPPPERDKIQFIKDVRIDNLSKSPARIYTDKHTIVLNPKFYNYSVEVRLFILLHELGHFYYKTEWKCDTYAAYHFLKFGCNPSEAFMSLAGVLHEKNSDGTTNERNEHRIENIFNLLSK